LCKKNKPLTDQSQGFFELFLDLLSGHRLINGHRLIDIDGNLGLGEVSQIGLVDLGVDVNCGRLTLTTGLDITRKLGILAIGQTPKNSGSDGHSLDIGIEGLKILESEALVEDQLEVLGGTTNLGGGLGGGGVHIRIVGYGVHYVSNLPEFVEKTRVFCNFLQKSFG
jgi:hypothetical protein